MSIHQNWKSVCTFLVERKECIVGLTISSEHIYLLTAWCMSQKTMERYLGDSGQFLYKKSVNYERVILDSRP